MVNIYLAGPITDCTEEQAIVWRRAIKNFIKNKKVKWFDPVEFEVDITNHNELVEKDLKYLFKSDLVVCNMWKPGIGTAMELVYAKLKNIPVLSVVPLGVDVSPWLRYHSTWICEIRTANILLQQIIDDMVEGRFKK